MGTNGTPRNSNHSRFSPSKSPVLLFWFLTITLVQLLISSTTTTIQAELKVNQVIQNDFIESESLDLIDLQKLERTNKSQNNSYHRKRNIGIGIFLCSYDNAIIENTTLYCVFFSLLILSVIFLVFLYVPDSCLGNRSRKNRSEVDLEDDCDICQQKMFLV